MGEANPPDECGLLSESQCGIYFTEVR